jgi:hypothetical protein
LAERATFFAEQGAGFDAVEQGLQHLVKARGQRQRGRLGAPQANHLALRQLAVLALG